MHRHRRDARHRPGDGAACCTPRARTCCRSRARAARTADIFRADVTEPRGRGGDRRGLRGAVRRPSTCSSTTPARASCARSRSSATTTGSRSGSCTSWAPMRLMREAAPLMAAARRRADRQRLLVGGQAPVADEPRLRGHEGRAAVARRACSPTATRRTRVLVNAVAPGAVTSPLWTAPGGLAEQAAAARGISPRGGARRPGREDPARPHGVGRRDRRGDRLSVLRARLDGHGRRLVGGRRHGRHDHLSGRSRPDRGAPARTRDRMAVNTAAIGKTFAPATYAVGREKIREYAHAVGETEPAVPRRRGGARGRLRRRRRAADVRRRLQPAGRLARAVRRGDRDRLRATWCTAARSSRGARSSSPATRSRRPASAQGRQRAPRQRLLRLRVGVGQPARRDGLHRPVDEHRAGGLMQPGDELAPLSVTPDKYLTVRYAGASGDFNPIHIDEEFARAGRPAGADPARPVHDGPGRARPHRGGRRAGVAQAPERAVSRDGRARGRARRDRHGDRGARRRDRR